MEQGKRNTSRAETPVWSSFEIQGAIPKCNIDAEEYEVICPAEGLYIVTGRMWIATDPSAEMYLKVHQRVTFVFQETEEGLKCNHIHCPIRIRR